MQQSTAPACSETNRYVRCHQACNGLTTNQSTHAKSCGRTITWKCSQHCTGIAEMLLHLCQFLSYQRILLLQVNYVQSPIILFNLILLT